MVARSAAALLTVATLFLLCTAPGRSDDACWNLLYAALEHNAGSAHAPFVTYTETLLLDEDGRPLERAHAVITYRDDGVASVDDDRFGQPFLSDVLEPGPPVLGPYGDRRSMWQTFGTEDWPLPVIANTETEHRHRCLDRGDETIDGVQYAHLVFPDAATDRPALQALWVARSDHAIRRVVLTGWLGYTVADSPVKNALVDYTLELAQSDGYAVIGQVNWRYEFPLYGGQRTVISEEYRFGDYHFESTAPAGSLFVGAEKAPVQLQRLIH